MIKIEIGHYPKKEDVVALYEANHWSSAKKPDQLFNGLINSTQLITAYDGERLVGLANALSDGHLVVYYPHMLVHPGYQGKGIGKMIMDEYQKMYKDFHQQILVADGKAIQFYEKCGFVKGGQTQSMWIYDGNDH